ncbi:MAG TPA: UDP-N-acetylmuramoyl-L-alanyl-D-glutamate--2,6-diaminopimelate ligase [Candidatus Saccharimonadales bacterium]|nr:UDP-N-acetylmuramoyl-L-alanyl-D-glutamate--2,6-diaminopimelate ligase [Candidatus Saccharimonadales bacterium]
MNFRKIVKAFIPRKLFRAVEPYGHWTEAALLNTLNNGSPARKMKVIGVTGTNGKTTTCFLIHRMLHEAGYKVGLMTTVGYGAGDKIKPQVDHMTTVPVPKLIKRLEKLKHEGVEWLVMETTSHALAQHRDFGIPYSVGVLTNITHEHLDYHGTFERYIAAKRMLFEKVNRNKKGLRTGVINADDPNADKFTSAVASTLTYGIKNGQLKAKNVELSAKGVSYKAVIGKDEYSINSHLPGKFNVYNTLAATAVGRTLGLSREQIERGIASLESVAGRMTAIEAGQSFNVIVDFAHSPDALENVLRACKELSKGKVILVFGATGDRDKSKRPIMGEVAAKDADQVFLTDDETYTEDPKSIIDAVYKGIEAAGGTSKTTIVEDRLKAIEAAFAAAKKGDTVLLTGIGHQTTRNMGGREEPWNEIEIAKKLLKKL